MASAMFVGSGTVLVIAMSSNGRFKISLSASARVNVARMYKVLFTVVNAGVNEPVGPYGSTSPSNACVEPGVAGSGGAAQIAHAAGPNGRILGVGMRKQKTCCKRLSKKARRKNGRRQMLAELYAME